MIISPNQKKFLRSRSHALKPIVFVGQKGLSDNVTNEIAGALEHHELIKVRINAANREVRDAMIHDIVTTLNAELIQRIGNIVSLYKQNPKKTKITLPKK